jgi:hypothetical protein
MSDPIENTVGCGCSLLGLLITVALMTATVAIVWRVLS